MQIPPLSKSLHTKLRISRRLSSREEITKMTLYPQPLMILFFWGGVYLTPAAVALLQIQIKLVVPLQQSQKTREGWPLLPNWIASLMLQFLI